LGSIFSFVFYWLRRFWRFEGLDTRFFGGIRGKNLGEWDARQLCYRHGLTTYLEVLTRQTIQLADERAAALVARRIIACAQLQLALGGNWNTKQLPGN
jgi:hypothetical protein